MPKKTPTGHIITEEDAEIGSLIGSASRRNKAVVEQFKQIAAQKGVKVSEAVEEALKLWTLSHSLREADPDTLIAAIQFINYMREQTIKELLALGKLFTSEFFKVQMGIANELIQAQAQAQQPAPQQPQNPTDQLKEQMRIQMLNMMMPMMMGIMQQITKAFAGISTTQNIPITQNTTKPQRKIEIEE